MTDSEETAAAGSPRGDPVSTHSLTGSAERLWPQKSPGARPARWSCPAEGTSQKRHAPILLHRREDESDSHPSSEGGRVNGLWGAREGCWAAGEVWGPCRFRMCTRLGVDLHRHRPSALDSGTGRAVPGPSYFHQKTPRSQCHLLANCPVSETHVFLCVFVGGP